MNHLNSTDYIQSLARAAGMTQADGTTFVGMATDPIQIVRLVAIAKVQALREAAYSFKESGEWWVEERLLAMALDIESSVLPGLFFPAR